MISGDQRLRSPARVLLVIDQPVLTDMVKLALNHGQYSIRVAQTFFEASSGDLASWRPHLVVLDMDMREATSWNALRTRRYRAIVSQ